LSISVGPSEDEQRIGKILRNEFHPTELEVRDISGGCGSMYQISITSKKFEGRRLVQQHRMVKDVLKEEIEKMHGYTLITLAPS
jgi:stress-induced morphogen